MIVVYNQVKGKLEAFREVVGQTQQKSAYRSPCSYLDLTTAVFRVLTYQDLKILKMEKNIKFFKKIWRKFETIGIFREWGVPREDDGNENDIFKFPGIEFQHSAHLCNLCNLRLRKKSYPGEVNFDCLANR